MGAESCKGDILALPEDCIAYIISFTNPRDACRLAILSSVLSSAIRYDFVWESFMPYDYRQILSRSVAGSDSLLRKFSSKKELYDYLCDHPILIDDGRKSFSLDRSTGKVCCMLSAKEVCSEMINRTSLPESRFSEVAEIPKNRALRIHGPGYAEMPPLTPDTKYIAYFVFSFNTETDGFKLPANPKHAKVELQWWPDKRKFLICLLPKDAIHDENLDDRYLDFICHPDILWPNTRLDGWLEIELWELFITREKRESNEDGREYHQKLQLDTDSWKCGIHIEGIEYRPKH
ncbi:F-box protein At2g02240-like [Andrographis paniculata]|uniref:F-box protein At2g02240-like n=1 Tax=Andrographis paniculata TaxID=175694 RepID=UPI0021E89446|nr:F-box protein At2g02240-like [Andrographis paniculata]